MSTVGMPRSKSPLKELPSLKRHRIPRPPRLRYFTVKPQGPDLYRGVRNPVEDNDWFSPPPQFLDPKLHGSAEEWPIYKGLMLKLDPGRDPRKPPYEGGKTWKYQKSLAGGRVPGGQVVDFVVDQGNRTLGIRVQTERYHVFAGPDKVAFDFYLKTHSVGIDLIIDIYSQYYLGDKSGHAAMVQVANALKGQQAPNPGVFGLGLQVRTPR